MDLIFPVKPIKIFIYGRKPSRLTSPMRFRVCSKKYKTLTVRVQGSKIPLTQQRLSTYPAPCRCKSCHDYRDWRCGSQDVVFCAFLSAYSSAYGPSGCQQMCRTVRWKLKFCLSPSRVLQRAKEEIWWMYTTMGSSPKMVLSSTAGWWVDGKQC